MAHMEDSFPMHTTELRGVDLSSFPVHIEAIWSERTVDDYYAMSTLSDVYMQEWADDTAYDFRVTVNGEEVAYFHPTSHKTGDPS